MSDSNSTLTQARLKELLHYDPETGVFTWLASTAARIKPGDVAGYRNKRDGRRRIEIGGASYLAHRLAWLYFYGEWPSGHLDHIHGDGHTDNCRIADLRDGSMQQNAQNQRKAHGNNKHSGLLGVQWERRKLSAKGKWFALIVVNGRRRRLGTFDTPEEAHDIYVRAKRQLHPGCTI
jgi:hypothetical protein